MMKFLVGVSALVLSGAASAQSMPLHQFVERGTRLEKKGPLALMQRGEIRALQTELQGASKVVRDERLAAERAGRVGAYCPPANGSGGVRMSPQQMLRELRAISARSPRTATTADGMRAIVVKRYPCPA